MKTFLVSLPITGIIYTEVEAENKKEAIEKASEQEFTREDIEEWEIHRTIVQGNVFHGLLNEASAEEDK